MWSRHSSLGWFSSAFAAIRFAKPWWRSVLLSLAANGACALFEGLSLGLIALALQVLGNPGDLSQGRFLGFLGGRLEGFRAHLGMERLFLILILLAILSQILRTAFQFLGIAWTTRVRTRIEAQATREVYSRILGLPFARASALPLGELTDYLQQPAHLNEAFRRMNDLFRNGLFLLAYAAVLCWLSWPLTGLALAAYAGISLLMGAVMRRVGESADEVRSRLLALTRRATEAFQALKVLHSFDRRGEDLQAMTALIEARRTGQAKAQLWLNCPEPITDGLTVVGVGLFLWVGWFLQPAKASGTLPVLLAFLAVIHRVAPRLRSVYTHLAGLTEQAPHIARMNKILAEKPFRETRGQPFRGLRRAIELEGVSFRYQPAHPPAVSNLTFGVPKGSFTALVGLSGTGKSTVADLFLRLYEPTQGVIRVDGIPLSSLDRRDWLAKVGSVAQQPFLFHASLRDNIAFGKPDASLEEIRSAAAAAHADGFIQGFAEGYDTIAGERGGRLSGGEAQRVALARALIRQPDLLILDEATSALDSESEQLIQQALEEQRGRRTILAIAHRLSTVARADLILVLAEGRLVEQGTHLSLIGQGGVYARLWKLQSEYHTSEVV